MSGNAPLAGLRILDLTRLLPGPAAAMHLADFGADVIKIEDPALGDPMRTMPPLNTQHGVSLNSVFEAVNRNKRSVAIDLKLPAGRDVFLRLVDGADAVVEGFRPGTLERLGLGWAALHARNRKLVVCAISGYGQDGPLSHAAGHDLNYLALAGVLHQTRSADANTQTAPAIPSVQVADILGGTLSSLSALLIALLAAQRTGVGSYVDVAMSEAVFAHHFFAHAALDGGRAPVPAAELLTGGAACYRCYRTVDARWLAVGALEHKFWSHFCRAVELNDLISHHWSLGEVPGGASARATVKRVAARIAERTLDQWMEVLRDADACASPVLSPEEARQQPQLAARRVLHTDAQGTTHIAPFARIGGHRPAAHAAPALGQHTDEVLQQAGLASDEIDSLRRTAIVR